MRESDVDFHLALMATANQVELTTRSGAYRDGVALINASQAEQLARLGYVHPDLTTLTSAGRVRGKAARNRYEAELAAHSQ